MYNKILILAPHTDDGELGCGGTIAKFVEEGKHITVAAFSTAEDSVPEGFPKNALEGEFKSAMSVLGVPEENLIIYKFKVRHFPAFRQEILEELVKIRSKINPDLVFVPSPNDIHQDHQVITAEGLRTFKKVSILGYELPWNNIVFETKCFVPLERRHIEKKILALECYRTQQHRSYLSSEFIIGLAKTRGTQFENAFAESFEVLRLIL
ncbi:MAG: PIG-L family deacetylase [Ignavibacteriales bacterium]|nr:PIG-L family deacetylase [Melioribacteraceae bacterium]MCF8315127.1 PIG-L family deacetylase [Ignavibacteriales bacterium]MCF8435877.1 PIG-L family deacetylase [Ignavibacteriales bacterium]